MVRTKRTARAKTINSNVATVDALKSVGAVMVGWIVSMIRMKALSFVQALHADRMHSGAITNGKFRPQIGEIELNCAKLGQMEPNNQ